MDDLLSRVEEVIAVAGEKLVADFPGLRRPIEAWDGARRVWILREHEPDTQVYVEVVMALNPFPPHAHGLDVREVAVEVMARAWSTDCRRASQERQIHLILVDGAEAVPDPGALQRYLDMALKKARELAELLPEEAKRIESYLEHQEQRAMLPRRTRKGRRTGVRGVPR